MSADGQGFLQQQVSPASGAQVVYWDAFGAGSPAFPPDPTLPATAINNNGPTFETHYWDPVGLVWEIATDRTRGEVGYGGPITAALEAPQNAIVYDTPTFITAVCMSATAKNLSPLATFTLTVNGAPSAPLVTATLPVGIDTSTVNGPLILVNPPLAVSPGDALLWTGDAGTEGVVDATMKIFSRSEVI